MSSAYLKATVMTLLIFGGIGYMVFKPELGFEGLNMKKYFSKEKVEESSTKEKKSNRSSSNSSANVGKEIDSYKGVAVYYNGQVGNVKGRNTTKDGYNLGLKYQCVEFAKRFYYDVYNHKMPDSYGHAKDFFDRSVPDGSYNKARNMIQYTNPSNNKPRKDDMVIIGPSAINGFGHIMVVTEVSSQSVSFIQQNPGARNPSRGKYELHNHGGQWHIDGPDIVGWLRMP